MSGIPLFESNSTRRFAHGYPSREHNLVVLIRTVICVFRWPSAFERNGRQRHYFFFFLLLLDNVFRRLENTQGRTGSRSSRRRSQRQTMGLCFQAWSARRVWVQSEKTGLDTSFRRDAHRGDQVRDILFVFEPYDVHKTDLSNWRGAEWTLVGPGVIPLARQMRCCDSNTSAICFTIPVLRHG